MPQIEQAVSIFPDGLKFPVEDIWLHDCFYEVCRETLAQLGKGWEHTFRFNYPLGENLVRHSRRLGINPFRLMHDISAEISNDIIVVNLGRDARALHRDGTETAFNDSRLFIPRDGDALIVTTGRLCLGLVAESLDAILQAKSFVGINLIPEYDNVVQQQ